MWRYAAINIFNRKNLGKYIAYKNKVVYLQCDLANNISNNLNTHSHEKESDLHICRRRKQNRYNH